MRLQFVSFVVVLALGGCTSAPTPRERSSTSASPTGHACPGCGTDVTQAVHEQCPRCAQDRWWTHATKPADAPPSLPMSVRCPRCAREVMVDVQTADQE